MNYKQYNNKCSLLITSLRDGMCVDRTALRNAGLTRIRNIDSGKKALDIIKDMKNYSGGYTYDGYSVEFIICTEHIHDMEFSDFIKQFMHIAGGNMPPLLFIANDDNILVKKLQEHANCTVLHRPYTINLLSKAINKAKTTKPACLDLQTVSALLFPERAKQKATDSIKKDASLLEPLAATTNETAACPPMAENNSATTDINPLLYSRMANESIRAEKLEEAEILFRKAVSYDPLDMEACMGVARIKKHQDNIDSMYRWLHRAGMICLRTGQPERAKNIFSRLPLQMQEGDPYINDARNLVLECDYDAASQAFIDIYTNQKQLPLHVIVGRTCQFTDTPELNLQELCKAMSRNGYESTAKHLAHRLLSPVNDTECSEENGMFAGVPLLQEALAVARFTVNAWKKSAA